MLDSPRLTIAARRVAPVVEDARPTEAVDDPVQRRDLILLEQARDGSLDAFNSLVECYQDHLYALVARMTPDRDQAADAVQEAFFSAYRNLRSFRGGSVRSWLSRIAINAAMDQQRLKKRRPSQPYPELEDESWQPPAGPEADPERTAMHGERARVLQAALAPEEKKRIVELLWLVAFADSRKDALEEHMIRKIAGLLGVPHPDFIDAKLRARASRGDSPGL